MRILLFISLFFCFSGKLHSQNAYENYIGNDTSQGHRLTIASSNLLGFEHTLYSNSFSTSIYGRYTKWKFTPKLLLAADVLFSNYYNSYKEYSTSNSHYYNELTLKGGASYYLNPNKFYLTVGGYGYTSYATSTTSEEVEVSFSEQQGFGYLNGAIGFGRIFNAVGIEYGLYFSESLVKHKIAKKRLSNKSLHQIASLIYKFKNGDLAFKYRDDAAVGLFKETEKLLLQNNDINSPFDVENAIRLYEILSNATDNYFIYQRYQGFQIQAQLQYQIFSDIKPHNHTANISGIYGIPISEKSNLLLSGYFSFPIDTLAGLSRGYRIYNPINNPNSNFYSLYPDYNNLSFFESYIGTGAFDGKTAEGNSIAFALQSNFTHSFNSYAGITLGANYFERIPKNYPKLGYFSLGAKMDYNIYSSLKLQGTLAYSKSIVDTNNRLGFNIGASYIIF